MNLEEMTKLIGLLRINGATHFKSNDFEISFNPSAGVTEAPILQTAAEVSSSQVQGPIDPVATKQAEDLIGLLKLKDNELVDVIFPDGSI